MTELYEPEVADLPKPDVEESAESGADGGHASAPAASYTAEGEEEEEGQMPADFERLWKLTTDNPQDFNSWTDLLQYCEQEVNVLSCYWGCTKMLVCFLSFISLFIAGPHESLPSSPKCVSAEVSSVLRLLEEVC